MNAISILMLVILVHLGGAELDSASEGSIEWFSAGTPSGRWRLADDYLFVGAEERVRVERLSHTDLAYTVVHTDDRGELLGLGAVSLFAYRDLLRVDRPFDALELPAEDALVAWHEAPVDAPIAEEGAPPGAEVPPQASAPPPDGGERRAVDGEPRGAFSVSASAGQLTIADPLSGQVMILRVIR